MWILYSIFIYLAWFFGWAASPFNEKLKKWVEGRKNWQEKLRSGVAGIENPIWIHCSSLGEFEQGRPLIEALNKQGEAVVLTFFSPSGYENLKNFKAAAFVSYLPLDTRANAKQFLDIVKPKAVMFVKYEFWYCFIREAYRNQIPVLLLSGIFRSSQYFFKFWGSPFLNQLKKFTHFFVQNELSQQLLNKAGIDQVTISGDTRFDRVLNIFESKTGLEKIEKFIQSDFVIVAGSTWLEDESMLIKLCSDNTFNGQVIIVPHEVSEDRVISITNKCTFPICRYSNELVEGELTKLMIVDQIGLLSKIYQYAQVAYIGGGFGKGIHNTLEAAVYGIPIIFGPNYSKFTEARDMLEQGGAVSVDKFKNFSQIVYRFKNDQEIRKQCGLINKRYVTDHKGATTLVISKLQEFGLVSK